MTNLHVVLLKLFEPVMDINFSKVCWISANEYAYIFLQIDKVDPEYFRASKRIRIDEETKIRGTKEEADSYLAKDGMDGPLMRAYRLS